MTLLACLALVAAVMMVRIGLTKNMLETRRVSRSCPSCRRQYQGAVCTWCSGR